MSARVAGESRALRRGVQAAEERFGQLDILAVYATGAELAIDGGYLAR